jgi:alpha-tubulin suppressor-like RCC1 family protein
MDVVKITEALHGKINATLSTEQVLILSKAIERLKLGNVKTVTAYADLLPLYPQKGEVYFVENEEKLYYGFGDYWYTIFDTTTAISYAWGSNSYGQLGHNTATTVSTSSPVSIIGGFTDWVQLAAGYRHSIGLRANRTIWVWGSNAGGALGDNTSTNKSSPVTVLGGFTDWAQVSAGGSFSLGVRANGTLWAWGSSSLGNLGDGTTINKSSPVLVAGGFTDWIQASAGMAHSLGVRANGTLYAWGANATTQAGVLGDNTISPKSSPSLVVGSFTDWFQASASRGHSLGIRGTGILYSWGINSSGQLGDNTSTSKSSPVSVVGGFTDWTQASAGNQFSLGVRSNGTLWAWGNGGGGKLGDNSTVNKSSPVSVVGGFTNWIQASAGNYHSFGIRTTGQLYSWGIDSRGQLGQNTLTVSTSSPVLVVGGFTDWIQVSGTSLPSGLTSTSLGLRIV